MKKKERFFLSPSLYLSDSLLLLTNLSHTPYSSSQTKPRTQLQWSKDTPRSGRSHRPQPGNKVSPSLPARLSHVSLSLTPPFFFLSPTNNINNKHLPKTTQSKSRTQLQWSKDIPRSGRSHRPQPGNKVTLSSSLSPTFSICHSPETLTRINKKNQTN